MTTETGQRVVQWRQDLHERPETGFGERRTAEYVAGVLEELGLRVTRGVAGTGVVAAALVSDGGLDGTVRFVFQPAEQHGLGATAMLADGLLRRFPMAAIFGLHNLPGAPRATSRRGRDPGSRSRDLRRARRPLHRLVHPRARADGQRRDLHPGRRRRGDVIEVGVSFHVRPVRTLLAPGSRP